MNNGYNVLLQETIMMKLFAYVVTNRIFLNRENSTHLCLAEFGLKLKAETDPSATLGAQYSLQRAFSRHFYVLQGAKFPVASPMGYGCICAPI